jgi:hypothetical protein
MERPDNVSPGDVEELATQLPEVQSHHTVVERMRSSLSVNYRQCSYMLHGVDV